LNFGGVGFGETGGVGVDGDYGMGKRGSALSETAVAGADFKHLLALQDVEVFQIFGFDAFGITSGLN
jgi:hypothetical protein